MSDDEHAGDARKARSVGKAGKAGNAGSAARNDGAKAPAGTARTPSPRGGAGGRAPREDADQGGPQPEEIRFFGTTWLHHDGGYAARRVGVAAGSLVAAAAGALLLRFGFQGLQIAAVGPLVDALVVAGFAICSALAFRRTWDGFVRRPDPSSASVADRSSQSMLTIGFIGSLLAWFCRSLLEAPGEKLHRAEYEAARERHARRRGSRTGNPAARRGKRR